MALSASRPSGPCTSWSPPVSRPPGGASGAGRTSAACEPGRGEHEDEREGVRREPCCDPHARHLRPPCSTAGRARSCASPPLVPHGGIPGWIVRGHARRVITLSSLAVRPLATLVSRPRPATATARLADPATLPSLDPEARPWPGREITAGGVTLHVREAPGADVEAVYVHGLSGSGTNWTDLSGLLAPRATGLAVDLPGFGFTRPPAAPDYTPSGHADALLRWLAGRGRPVHLLGNSLGGAIVLVVAARCPELVRSLTLVSPAMPDFRPDPRRVSDPRLILSALPGPRGSARPRRARHDDQPRPHRQRGAAVLRRPQPSPPSTASPRRPPSSTPAAASPGPTRRSTAPRRRCCAAGGVASRCGRWRRG